MLVERLVSCLVLALVVSRVGSVFVNAACFKVVEQGLDVGHCGIQVALSRGCVNPLGLVDGRFNHVVIHVDVITLGCSVLVVRVNILVEVFQLFGCLFVGCLDDDCVFLVCGNFHVCCNQVGRVVKRVEIVVNLKCQEVLALGFLSVVDVLLDVCERAFNNRFVVLSSVELCYCVLQEAFSRCNIVGKQDGSHAAYGFVERSHGVVDGSLIAVNFSQVSFLYVENLAGGIDLISLVNLVGEVAQGGKHAVDCGVCRCDGARCAGYKVRVCDPAELVNLVESSAVRCSCGIDGSGDLVHIRLVVCLDSLVVTVFLSLGD